LDQDQDQDQEQDQEQEQECLQARKRLSVAKPALAS
jgi:hypothetical protein